MCPRGTGVPTRAWRAWTAYGGRGWRRVWRRRGRRGGVRHGGAIPPCRTPRRRPTGHRPPPGQRRGGSGGLRRVRDGGGRRRSVLVGRGRGAGGRRKGRWGWWRRARRAGGAGLWGTFTLPGHPAAAQTATAAPRAAGDSARGADAAVLTVRAHSRLALPPPGTPLGRHACGRGGSTPYVVVHERRRRPPSRTARHPLVVCSTEVAPPSPPPPPPRPRPRAAQLPATIPTRTLPVAHRHRRFAAADVVPTLSLPVFAVTAAADATRGHNARCRS